MISNIFNHNKQSIMKQVTQTLKSGLIEINEVPIPTIEDTFVLVKNTHSVISAGTEKTKIDMGKKNLYQKAKARPDLVKQVLKKIKKEGLKKTFQTVKSRLNSPSPLGYSCSGEVIAVGGLVEGIQPGDRVACGGANYANHADFVAVPKNLVVKIPKNVSNEEAAFATVGAIAMQGVRLADPKIGEVFLVLGLGLLGQITIEILLANGCKVIATDLDADLTKRAEEIGAIPAYYSTEVDGLCKQVTGGHGVDGVLVCAGTNSNQPIELCGNVTREKGRVVVVGAIRMDIPREDFFKKEISVVISRSYGPGRYDSTYEERGHDYPFGYVRFTEQRNMKTFLELIEKKKINVNSLITHKFKMEEASEAYQLIEGKKTEPYLGILLQYENGLKMDRESARITLKFDSLDKKKIGISFFGAGNYATGSLLPELIKLNSVELRGLVTSSGRTAQGVAKQFGFAFCAGEYKELLNADTDMVMITTRHSTHAEAVVGALEMGKHVYVEKPLALNVEECKKIHNSKKIHSKSQIMVGFNRRFAPSTKYVLEHFANVKSPLIVNIRINSGLIPADHWIQDPSVGGGRIIGEGCHFFDLASAIVNGVPVRVSCVGTNKPDKSAVLNDNVLITLTFDNGSIANIIYTSDGPNAMQKEMIEVFGGGRGAVINDFKEVLLYEEDEVCKIKKMLLQDKGQKNMLQKWIENLKDGRSCIPYDTVMMNSLAAILSVESLSVGYPLDVGLLLLEDNNSIE